ncbi:MAG: hypothetical protein ASARMPRED_007594 [Alectoria sarmentosa]|nr:MAG: hypothetical protein ASARMPRED_007594 [Alectoria sarmentosa]
MFPFLKLPFELRSKIYRYWLSAKYVKKDLTEGKEDSEWEYHPTYAYGFEPAILRTNRQINHEGSHVLYYENMLVTFSSDYYNEDDLDLDSFGLRITADAWKVSHFQYCALSIKLKADEKVKANIELSADFPRNGMSNIIFPGEDLPAFCRSLLRQTKNRHTQYGPNFLTTSSLEVELNCPVGRSEGENDKIASYAPKLVEQLLQPLRQLHSLQHAYIIGDIDEKFKADLCASICNDLPSGDSVVRDVVNTIKKGNEAFANSEFEEAISIYKAAAKDNHDRACRWPVAVYTTTPGAIANTRLHYAFVRNRFVLRNKLAKTYLQMGAYEAAYKWSERAAHEIKCYMRTPRLNHVPRPFQEGDETEAHLLKAHASEGMGRLGEAFQIVKDLVWLDRDPMLEAELKRLERKIMRIKLKASQINKEAEHIFHNGNQFVSISHHYDLIKIFSDLPGVFENYGIKDFFERRGFPILATEQTTRDFKYCAMDVFLGHVNEQYKSNIRTNMMKEPPTAQDMIITGCANKAEGDEAYRNRDFPSSISAYEKAYSDIEADYQLTTPFDIVAEGKYAGVQVSLARQHLLFTLLLGIVATLLELREYQNAYNWTSMEPCIHKYVLSNAEVAWIWYLKSQASRWLGQSETSYHQLVQAVLLHPDDKDMALELGNLTANVLKSSTATLKWASSSRD